MGKRTEFMGCPHHVQGFFIRCWLQSIGFHWKDRSCAGHAAGLEPDVGPGDQAGAVDREGMDLSVRHSDQRRAENFPSPRRSEFSPDGRISSLLGAVPVSRIPENRSRRFPSDDSALTYVERPLSPAQGLDGNCNAREHRILRIRTRVWPSYASSGAVRHKGGPP
jgi:hypothetical protein